MSLTPWGPPPLSSLTSVVLQTSIASSEPKSVPSDSDRRRSRRSSEILDEYSQPVLLGSTYALEGCRSREHKEETPDPVLQP